MTEALGIIATILAVAGVWLNNRKLIACFYLWLISNAISAYCHYDVGLNSLLMRDAIFLVLAVEGILKWRKPKKGKNE